MNTVVSIDKSRGFTRMDNDLYEALIGAELSGRELRVALAIHRMTAGFNVDSARVAASYIAEMSGIHREDVSRAISELLRQRVLMRAGGARSPIGFASVNEWSIDKKNTHKNKPKEVPQCGVSTTSNVAFLPHNKERNTNTTSDEVVVAEQADRKPRAKSDAVPAQAIADLFNQICVDLPKVALLNTARKSAIRARWNENTAHRDLEFWADYFSTVQASDFLTGKIPGRNGGKSFRASFDWVMAPTNFAKVVEGNYHA